ncbi:MULTISPECIES: hypothetical protein [unclassified Mesorhizobium]|nr:hypothetical protein [Mesorhizobium sp. LSHC420B00]ESX63721.1 hypothetical protein X759_33330 [Mesorhizobium sp. LSHC420B00]
MTVFEKSTELPELTGVVAAEQVADQPSLWSTGSTFCMSAAICSA